MARITSRLGEDIWIRAPKLAPKFGSQTRPDGSAQFVAFSCTGPAN